MGIPLVDLKAQYRPLKADILSRISMILDGMQLFLGPNVQAFEREFADFHETPHAIGVSDGTAALRLALMACGVGAGDEVIVPSHTFIATAEAVVLVGARPVFVDVDPLTYTIAVDQIAPKITAATRAIIPVHLYGQPADMDPLTELASRHGLWVIEDACQAHGARYKGQRVGGLGHAAAFSFYFSKNLGAYGEGGMVTTTSDDLADRVRMLRDHGSAKRYCHELVGANSRLDEIQAAVLRAKLPYLDEWNEQRRSHAAHYDTLLANLPEVQTPRVTEYAEHVFHLYVVRTPRRDALRQYLWERYQIGTGIHYPIPCHRQPAFQMDGDLPVTDQVAGEILSLPMYPELTAGQRCAVVGAMQQFLDTQAGAVASS